MTYNNNNNNNNNNICFHYFVPKTLPKNTARVPLFQLQIIDHTVEQETDFICKIEKGTIIM